MLVSYIVSYVFVCSYIVFFCFHIFFSLVCIRFRLLLWVTYFLLVCLWGLLIPCLYLESRKWFSVSNKLSHSTRILCGRGIWCRGFPTTVGWYERDMTTADPIILTDLGGDVERVFLGSDQIWIFRVLLSHNFRDILAVRVANCERSSPSSRGLHWPF